jgi:type I restriction enzyme M protein
MGTLIDRVHRELTDADIEEIVGTYHAWRFDDTPGRRGAGQSRTGLPNPARIYQTSPASANPPPRRDRRARLRPHPGPLRRRRGVEDDGEPFEEKMTRLVAELNAQFAESAQLEQAIQANLMGYGI